MLRDSRCNQKFKRGWTFGNFGPETPVSEFEGSKPWKDMCFLQNISFESFSMKISQ